MRPTTRQAEDRLLDDVNSIDPDDYCYPGPLVRGGCGRDEAAIRRDAMTAACMLIVALIIVAVCVLVHATGGER